LPPSFTRDFQPVLLRIPRPAFWITPTGLSPSTVWHSSQVRLLQRGCKAGSCNSTSPLAFARGFGLPSSPFGRPYSGNPYWFLFLRLLRCFSSAGSRSQKRAPQVISLWQEVPFGDLGIYGCMRLPRAYRSLPRPSSAPKPSHPPGGVGVSGSTKVTRLALNQALCATSTSVILSQSFIQDSSSWIASKSELKEKLQKSLLHKGDINFLERTVKVGCKV